jgi:hypothetical protein
MSIVKPIGTGKLKAQHPEWSGLQEAVAEKLKPVVVAKQSLPEIDNKIVAEHEGVEQKCKQSKLTTFSKTALKPMRGQAILPVVLFMLFGVMFLGVLVEAGHLFISRRQLQNDADAAATWGAMQLDIRGLRDSDGSKVHVMPPGSENSPGWAGSKIEEYMQELGFNSSEYQWYWGKCTMQMQITRKVPTVFAGLFGIKEVPVATEAHARLNNSDNRTECS